MVQDHADFGINVLAYPGFSTLTESLLFSLRWKRQNNTTLLRHTSKRYHTDSNIVTWLEASHRILPLSHRYWHFPSGQKEALAPLFEVPVPVQKLW